MSTSPSTAAKPVVVFASNRRPHTHAPLRKSNASIRNAGPFFTSKRLSPSTTIQLGDDNSPGPFPRLPKVRTNRPSVPNSSTRPIPASATSILPFPCATIALTFETKTLSDSWRSTLSITNSVGPLRLGRRDSPIRSSPAAHAASAASAARAAIITHVAPRRRSRGAFPPLGMQITSPSHVSDARSTSTMSTVLLAAPRCAHTHSPALRYTAHDPTRSNSRSESMSEHTRSSMTSRPIAVNCRYRRLPSHQRPARTGAHQRQRFPSAFCAAYVLLCLGDPTAHCG